MHTTRILNIFRLIIVLSLISFLISCNSNSGPSDGQKGEQTVQYDLVEQGYNSGYTLEGGVEVNDVILLAIKSQNELDKFWALHKAIEIPPGAAPIIDFEKKMIIVVICPVYPSGGYGIKLDQLYDEEKELAVNVTVTSPGSSCIVPDELTQPYIIIETDISELPVTLNLTKNTKNC
jgi:hypothetical protein